MSDQPIIHFEMPEWASTPFDYPSELAQYLCAPDHDETPEFAFHTEDSAYVEAYFALDVCAEHVASGGDLDSFVCREELLDNLRAVPEVAQFLDFHNGNKFLEMVALRAIVKHAAIILNARNG